ncbi:F-box protein skip23 [Thalictrum thalictroides]|uniref:F-box protein skip23 n=1 Tax=Thalictrum thalictroides TaxID=46969 RepID=A0A7J6XA74_THATH|nr:F-box protein skip23 [Thalictrum thalictroides]
MKNCLPDEIVDLFQDKLSLIEEDVVSFDMENCLPDEIVDIFRDKLSCIEDVVSFGSVCKSWQQSYETWKKMHIPFAPWLMLTNYDNHQALQTYYSLSTKRIFNIPLPQTQIQGRRCVGSRFGWLVTIGVDLQIHMLNPISQLQISLPSQPTFPNQFQERLEPEELRRHFVYKFILSSNPSNSDQPCFVMAINASLRKLAFAKPGDEAWTSIDCPASWYFDAVFFDGQFYAFNGNGDLVVCEINKPHPKATKIASPPEDIRLSNRYYLVEMLGVLHLVERGIDAAENPPRGQFYYTTCYFQVYKFDSRTSSWTELSDLGDHALFLGNNTSFAVSTSNYPEFKSNCIYFTDDHIELYESPFCDMGIYDFETATIEPIYVGDYVLTKFSRPLFIMPSA